MNIKWEAKIEKVIINEDYQMKKTEKEHQTTLEQSTERKKDFSFFYDVIKLVTGNGLSQVLKAFLSPIISRLFLPEFFGVTQNF